MSPAPRLRQLRPAELASVLDWAAQEGWNPGLDDAPAFHAADPAGFFGAEAAGELVGAISLVNHAPEQAFLGLYICKPDWRGRGIGLALWRHALAHAGERCIGLDGVAAQEPNYRRAGFVRQGATTRYLGRLPPLPCPGLRPVRGTDLPALHARDQAAQGYARPRFLAAWLRDSAHRRSFVLESPAAADGIAGLVTLRRCRSGLKAGPLLAANADTGLALLSGALAMLAAAPVPPPANGLPQDMAQDATPELAIDLPEDSTALAQALRLRGFAPVFTTARMYRGPAPGATHDTGLKSLAIATMELG